MEVIGYKGFNSNKTNRYGKSFLEGGDYHIDGPISFGNRGNGFHMCKHLSDVFRFFDPKDVVVARVVGSGEVVEGEYDDWDEPYYEMYSVSDIHIDKFLSREDIIEIMKTASSSDIVKFMATFDVTEEEGLRIIRNCREKIDYRKAIMAFLYYLKKVKIYEMGYEDKERTLKKVLEDGQDNCKGCARK